ncbi:hypothetical protein [Flavobacterium sp. N1736]|uniref:hypothetical protein n=1 Tax=Flavobacterium sp. N1736 TaxID=2986823 RepID=UPI00222478E0|nr:hypothetical protein [Flavobacterium sp. N1736]
MNLFDGLNLAKQKKEIIALKKAINEGFKRGIAKNFNSKEHLASLKAKRIK